MEHMLEGTTGVSKFELTYETQIFVLELKAFPALCLSPAPYRIMLKALHAEMLAEIQMTHKATVLFQ
jgi:hypothetical protein